MLAILDNRMVLETDNSTIEAIDSDPIDNTDDLLFILSTGSDAW